MINFILASLMVLPAVPVLPEVDRRSLDAQARIEARSVRTAPSTPARAATRERAVSPAFRTASSSINLDISAITTICRAAGSQPDPEAFLTTLGRAYWMSAEQNVALRSSCAGYRAGRADARAVRN